TNVWVDGRDEVKLVILGITSNAVVDFLQMRVHSINQRLGKFADTRFSREKFPEIFHFFRAIAVLHVAPEMILQRGLARLPPPAHRYGRVRRSEITLAISIAARAASVPRLILSSRQRSRASSSLVKVWTQLITGMPYSSAIRWSASVTE